MNQHFCSSTLSPVPCPCPTPTSTTAPTPVSVPEPLTSQLCVACPPLAPVAPPAAACVLWLDFTLGYWLVGVGVALDVVVLAVEVVLVVEVEEAVQCTL